MSTNFYCGFLLKNVYLLGYFFLFQQIETVFCVVKPSLNIYISGYILYRHY